MSKIDNLEYYARRAKEELAAAARSEILAISEPHRVMAEHYETLVNSLVPDHSTIMPEPQSV